jgi:hypothetical protein
MPIYNRSLRMRTVARPPKLQMAAVGADLDFDPRDIGRTAWWITAQTLKGLPDSGNILAWPDKSGWGLHAKVAGVGFPTLQKGVFNTRPVMHTSGTNQNMSVAALILVQPLQYFMVVRDPSATEDRGFLDGLGGRTLVERSGGKWLIYAGTILNGQNADLNTHTLSTEFNGASSKFHVDGTLQASGNANTQGTTAGIAIPVAASSRVDIAEMSATRGRLLLQSERKRLERRAHLLYGIAVAA